MHRYLFFSVTFVSLVTFTVLGASQEEKKPTTVKEETPSATEATTITRAPAEVTPPAESTVTPQTDIELAQKRRQEVLERIRRLRELRERRLTAQPAEVGMPAPKIPRLPERFPPSDLGRRARSAEVPGEVERTPARTRPRVAVSPLERTFPARKTVVTPPQVVEKKQPSFITSVINFFKERKTQAIRKRAERKRERLEKR